MVVPADTPVIDPVTGSMVAAAGVLLLHEPLGVASVRLAVMPVQMVVDPPIDAGEVPTVMGALTLQPPAV